MERLGLVVDAIFRVMFWAFATLVVVGQFMGG